MHYTEINTMTYKQINYMYIHKESVRCILIKIKFFSNFKGFHNEHGYISYFNFIFCFYKFNQFGHTQYFPIIWFNFFFLNSWYNGHSSKKMLYNDSTAKLLDNSVTLAVSLN